MRIAVLILPEEEKLPTAEDFRRAGFAVSDAVDGPPGPNMASRPESGIERQAGKAKKQSDARPGITDLGPGGDKGPDTPPAKTGREADRPEKTYCTSSKPSRAASTSIPS